MKTLLAKMKVASVTDYGNNNREAKLTAVQRSGTGTQADENSSFSLYTPRADVSILINNPDRINFFIPGDEFYLLFTKERPADQDRLIGLLTDCFRVGHAQFRRYNLFKVIGNLLTENGIKLFIDDSDNVFDLEFLSKQLTSDDFNSLALTCPLGDKFAVTISNSKVANERIVFERIV